MPDMVGIENTKITTMLTFSTVKEGKHYLLTIATTLITLNVLDPFIS